MKKFFCYPAIIFFTLFCSTVMAGGTVAQVGQIEISSFELELETSRILPQAGFHGNIPDNTMNMIRKKALGDLITRAYMANYAIDQGMKVDNKKVDSLVMQVQSRFANPKDLQKALGGASLKDFRVSIERLLLARMAEEKVVTSRAVVKETEIVAHYQQNQKDFSLPKQFRASQILIRTEPGSTESEQKEKFQRARDLATKARAGEDFYNLAYYNSEDRTRYVGGDMGVLPLGGLDKVLEEALSTMKPGEIAGPIKSESGYHILKLGSIDEARQRSFEEARASIKKQLEDAKREKLYNTWIEDLMNQYPLKHFPSTANSL